MKSKILFTRPSFIISLIAILFFSIMMLVFGSPSQGAYIKPASGAPIRLKIPELNINASIKSLGLTPDGAMDTTKGPYDVAWFKFGPRPGETGSAVIAGHYGIWKNGAISVFHDLDKLHKGDKISIKDNKGMTISFIVRESKMYKLNANASDVFFSKDGKSHLNLITCMYDSISKTYPKRLVIFTDKE